MSHVVISVSEASGGGHHIHDVIGVYQREDEAIDAMRAEVLDNNPLAMGESHTEECSADGLWEYGSFYPGGPGEPDSHTLLEAFYVMETREEL